MDALWKEGDRSVGRIYNRKGIFSNADDDERGLERGLAFEFGDLEIEMVGAVAPFGEGVKDVFYVPVRVNVTCVTPLGEEVASTS